MAFPITQAQATQGMYQALEQANITTYPLAECGHVVYYKHDGSHHPYLILGIFSHEYRGWAPWFVTMTHNGGVLISGAFNFEW